MSSNFQTLFVDIDRFLDEHECYWRFQPFRLVTHHHSASFPWDSVNPELSHAIRDLTPQQVAGYRNDSEKLLMFVSSYIDGLKSLTHLCDPIVEQEQNAYLAKLNPAFYNGIPGRKVDQIKSMANISLCSHRGNQWLEWCSGKGYLGRVISASTLQRVVSFEFQNSLCEAGQQYADKHRLPMTFVQGDAMSPDAKLSIPKDAHALALHACGDLHVQLVHYVAELSLPAVSFAPCCYHLSSSRVYQPISGAYQQALLSLDREELRIPLQETVTGGARVRRHRELEMIYRLGFDLILKQEFGDSLYSPLPSIKKSMLSDGFEAFCLWGFQQKQRRVGKVDFSYYQCLAEQRFHQMERLSLVQQAFYTLVEMWIVLDKVLFLEEKGYRVELKRFCDKSVTPRNIFIHAERIA